MLFFNRFPFPNNNHNDRKFLTNFDASQLHIYIEALKIWEQSPDTFPGFYVLAPWKNKYAVIPSDGALCYSGDKKDLEPFWKVFDQVKAQFKANETTTPPNPINPLI